MVWEVDLGRLQGFLQRRVIVVKLVKQLIVDESSQVVVVELAMGHSCRAVAIVMVAMAAEVPGALYLYVLKASAKIEDEKHCPAWLGKPKGGEECIRGVAHRRPHVVGSLNNWNTRCELYKLERVSIYTVWHHTSSRTRHLLPKSV
jgi:hypothetical protein